MLNLIFLNECNSKNNYIAMEERLLAIDENELKNWMTDLSPAPSPAWATLRGETSQVYQGYKINQSLHEIDPIYVLLNVYDLRNPPPIAPCR